MRLIGVILGAYWDLVTFPVSATGQWPRHGHLRGILDGFQGRQPNFYKWARPACEQGVLPTLSLLPGEVAIKVLPGDKIYQAMEMEPGFMRPAMLHDFGTRPSNGYHPDLRNWRSLAGYHWGGLACAGRMVAAVSSRIAGDQELEIGKSIRQKYLPCTPSQGSGEKLVLRTHA